jgi:hypothetical protein
MPLFFSTKKYVCRRVLVCSRNFWEEGWSTSTTASSSIFLFSIRTAHHDGQRLWPIASPVAPPPPNRLAALHPNTMGDAPHVRFGRNQWRGRVIGGDLTKLLKTIFYTRQSTEIWPIASPVAPPPPNHLAALHPNTMGDAPHVWFGRNQWRGRVIGGDLTKLLKTIFYTRLL